MGQEATVRTVYGTTDWFKIKKGYDRAFCCHTCLFNLYAEHIMKNARLDELQAGIKIGRRNISNLRYSNDTTLMAEREDELKNLLMRVKEESGKAGLKLNIKKKEITSPGWMHETSARAWCTGKTQRNRVEREVGGGIRMGNTCKSMAE